MGEIVECVPNFSEGVNDNIIKSITSQIEATEGVKLLNVDPNPDYNRTVVTFVGNSEGVEEAAFRATKKAAELIDMSRHRGGHPRVGATDAVPFVPVSGVKMEDCVQIANGYARRVGDELGIPIYLYEEAATRPERRNLATVRKGEYEGLPQKLRDPQWKPDYGPSEFNPKSGATMAGARFFLIAYNVNLNTNDKNIAHEIALRIRESGRPLRDKEGKIIKDEKGKTKRIPGSLKAVKAIGVLLEEHNIAQVSINLINYNITPPHRAFEEVKKDAEDLGVEVTGSEIVGLTPKEALLEAGRYWLTQKGKGLDLPEEELIKVSIDYLGLSQLASFIPEEKIIEDMI